MVKGKKMALTALILIILGIFGGCSTLKGFLEDVTVTLGYKAQGDGQSTDTTNGIISEDTSQQKGGE